MPPKKDRRTAATAESRRKDQGKDEDARSSAQKRRPRCIKADEFEQMNGAESAYFGKA